MVRLGYDVEHRPTHTADDLASGLDPTKKPDFRIEGEIFDAYSPTTASPRNIALEIEKKIRGRQTQRVIVNLTDSPYGVEEVMHQLSARSIDRLSEVIILDDGSVVGHWLPIE